MPCARWRSTACGSAAPDRQALASPPVLAGKLRPRQDCWEDVLDQPNRADFEHVLAFRTSLRRFQRWSEDEARAAGLTHVQHQLLVAIKGHPGAASPTIGDLANYLLLRPHSAVELVDRA